MKKAKLRKFAEWLREQPNKQSDGTPLFSWHDSHVCVAAYAQAWDEGRTIPGQFGVTTGVLVDIFNMPWSMASQIYTGGLQAWTRRGREKMEHAKLTKVADVIDLLAEGWGVGAAMEATFGKRSFYKA